jgi:hypothetical protein
MGARIIDVGCTIQCPHGGEVAVIMSANTVVSVGGNLAALATDSMTITGCSFNVSGSPVPCVTIQWSGPATRVSVSAVPVLLEASVGLCLNAAGAPQGTAIVNGVQTQVSGQ